MELILTYLILTAVGLYLWYKGQKIKLEGQCVMPKALETPFSKPEDVLFTGKAASTVVNGNIISSIIILVILMANLVTNWLDTVGLFFITAISVFICQLVFQTIAYRIYETE